MKYAITLYRDRFAICSLWYDTYAEAEAARKYHAAHTAGKYVVSLPYVW